MNPLEDFERLADEARDEAPPEIDVIDAVMQRVGEASASSFPAETKTEQQHLLRPLARWTVVAGLFLGVAVWWLSSGSSQALAEVEQALAAMTEPSDRTYSIQAEVAGPIGLSRQREGTLYLRGRDHLMVRLDGPLGSEILGGTDGSESWVMPPIGPVLVSSDPHQFEEWLSRHHGPSPLLRIDTVLQRVTEGYELTEARNTDGERYIVATRLKSTDASRPDTVHLWTDAATGTVLKLEVEWNRARTAPGPRHVTVTLTSEESLPAGFFRHQHHAGDRSVRTLPGK